MLRLAFIGCGSIARHHLRALQTSGCQATVCAAVDTNPEAAHTFVGGLSTKECQVFNSLEALIQWGQFDGVVIMLPHDLHESCATECLRAGKHVLLEKPLAHSLSACVKLMKVAESADALLMVGEQSPYWPEVVKAKELIASGEIGQVYFAKANYWESASSSFTKEGVHQVNWRFDPLRVGGGCLMDGATHWVRPLRTWFGDISEVIGTVGHPLQRCGGESLANVLLRFSNGLTASLYCHYNDIPMHPLPFFQIFGDKGEITIDGSFAGGMSLVTQSNPGGQRFDSLGGYNAGFVPQMRAFLTSVQEGKRGGESCREALQEVLVANAVYKSIQTKRWENTTLDNLLDTTAEYKLS